MSLEHARALIDKLKHDEAFRLSILAIADVNARIRAIIDAGFTCSIEEIQKTSSEISSGDEVSGGSWLLEIFPCPWYS